MISTPESDPELVARVRACAAARGWPAAWVSVSELTPASFDRSEVLSRIAGVESLEAVFASVEETIPEIAAVREFARQQIGSLPPRPRETSREIVSRVMAPTFAPEFAASARDLGLLFTAVQANAKALASWRGKCFCGIVDMNERRMRSAVAAMRQVDPSLRELAREARGSVPCTCLYRLRLEAHL